MAKPKKDGQFISFYLDRNLCNRLTYYSDQMGQTKTLAIERILKKFFDEQGIPENPPVGSSAENSENSL